METLSSPKTVLIAGATKPWREFAEQTVLDALPGATCCVCYDYISVMSSMIEANFDLVVVANAMYEPNDAIKIAAELTLPDDPNVIICSNCIDEPNRKRAAELGAAVLPFNPTDPIGLIQAVQRLVAA